MALYRVTYTPVTDAPPVRVVEAPTASHAAAEVYPDADHSRPVRVKRMEDAGRRTSCQRRRGVSTTAAPPS